MVKTAIKLFWRNSFLKKMFNIFFYKKATYNKVLVMGGYGFNNVGDEAQLNATLKDLYELFPTHMIQVLTPNLHYTYNYHERCLVANAPREAFYDLSTHYLYRKTDNPLVKIHFLLRALLIYLNAYLVRADLPTVFINAKKSALLQEMKCSDMLYFEGGGYLTGKTLSRLLDGMFAIRIANIFGVPTFLSGQTIGVWNNSFNKKISKWGLKKAKSITLRDPIASIKALNEIGLKGEHIYSTHDDALFCDKIDDIDEVNNKLIESGLSENDINNGYITFHMHYWGLKTKIQKLELLNQMEQIILKVRKKTNKKIVLLSMTPSDEETINDFKGRFEELNVTNLNYEYSFKLIRSIISGSEMCITMKHHPIIFALGERVPVISMALSDYYIHKNEGALELLGLKKFSVDLSKENYLESFGELLSEIHNNRENINDILDDNFKRVKEAKSKFLLTVKASLV